MGRVSGTILVNGPKNGQKKVYLYGPQVRTHREAITAVGNALGKDLKITDLNEDEGRAHFAKAFPPPIVDYFIRVLEEAKSVEFKDRFPKYQEGVENVKLYTGRSSTNLPEWVKENKGLFNA